ncbi:MAG: hypothetical protein H2057_02535 [Alphaproteobacteria bacterium]|nr:hypothetical protein [Alphaproteobacteria bacterium]
MKTRFNIALCPSEKVQEAYFKTASIFQDRQMNYCLTPARALAHVTLSQFNARDTAGALSCAVPFLGRSISVMPLHFYAHLDEAPGQSGLWVGHGVRREESLISLQEEVVGFLKEQRATPLQKTGNDYFPHFTLARIALEDMTLPASIFEAPPMKELITCEVRLGRSDEWGQFLEILG